MLALVSGEASRLNIAAVTTRSWMAYAYLVSFGSLLGFTAFIWLLQACDPAKVATYAYVNPLVAVFLGWALGGERITLPMLLGAAMIVPAVALIVGTQSGDKPRVPAGQPAACAASQTNPTA